MPDNFLIFFPNESEWLESIVPTVRSFNDPAVVPRKVVRKMQIK